MPDAALAGAGRAQLAWILADGLGERREIGPGSILAHEQGGGVAIDHHEGTIVPVRQVRQSLPVQHVDLDGHHYERVAVGSGASAAIVARDTLTAGGVDDVDRLSELVLQELRDLAGDAIRAAAYGPRADQEQGAIRVLAALVAATESQRRDEGRRDDGRHEEPREDDSREDARHQRRAITLKRPWHR